MEQQPSRKENQERAPGEPAQILEASADSLEEKVASLATQEGRGEVSEATVERAKKKAGLLKKFVNIASIGAALVGANEIRGHATSRYEITTVTREDGSVAYEHEDPETNRIMAYMTGEKPLAEEDRLFFYRQVVREAYRDHQRFLETFKENSEGIGIDDLNAYEEDLPMDEQGLRKKLTEIYAYENSILGDLGRGTPEERVTKAFEEVVAAPIKYDPAFAKILWNIQKKVGAPRIRWAAPGENMFSTAHGKFAGAGRANYHHLNNTVYITPGTVGATLIAEDAHAHQFNHHPVQSRIHFLTDTAKTIASVIRNGKTFYEEQHAQYSTPGTLEYEAHKVIEPKLIEEAEEEERRLKKK